MPTRGRSLLRSAHLRLLNAPRKLYSQSQTPIVFSVAPTMIRYRQHVENALPTDEKTARSLRRPRGSAVHCLVEQLNKDEVWVPEDLSTNNFKESVAAAG